MLAEAKTRDVSFSVFHYIEVAYFIYWVIKRTSVKWFMKMCTVDTLVP